MRLYYKQILYSHSETYAPNSTKTIQIEDSVLINNKCICLSHYDLYDQNMRLCSYKCYNLNFVQLWIKYVGTSSLTVSENKMHVGIIYTSK